MQIDEKWLSEAAGWKAVKEAKALLSSDAVSTVIRRENEFQGVVGFGKACKRPKVRIQGKFDVSTVCTCMEARRSGAFCTHAVAMILLWIQKGDVDSTISSEKSDSNKNITPSLSAKESEQTLDASLMLHFPPQFMDVWAKRHIMPLRVSVVAEQLIEQGTLNQASLRLLHHISPDLLTKGGMFQAKEGELMVLLRTLANSDGIVSGEKAFRINDQVLRPNVRIEHNTDSDQLDFYVIDLPKLVFLNIANSIWGWGEEENMLTELSFLQDAIFTKNLYERGKASISEHAFISQINQWNERVHIDWEASPNFTIEEASPTFDLVISGGSKKLVAELYVCYAEDIRFKAGSISSETWKHFPIRAQAGAWSLRNINAETDACERLDLRGFVAKDVKYILEGDDRVAEFLAITLTDLEVDWNVILDANIHAYRSNLEPLRPKLEINERGSSEDWLAFDFDFRSAGGTQLTLDQVRRLLQQGRNRVRGKSGKELVISAGDVAEMESVFLDVDPKQVSGRYEVTKQQGLYLRNLHNASHPLVASDISLNLTDPEIHRLRPYQKDGVVWLVSQCTRAGGAVLADDMGLGKTLQTLSLVQHFTSIKKPSLVVCPKSLIGNWAAECEKFFPSLKHITYHGGNRQRVAQELVNANLVISTYDIVTRDLDFFKSIDFQIVALDEASLIRNADTESAKAVMRLKRAMSIALTGTPVENSVRDLWSIFQFALPGYLGRRSDFQLRYEKPMKDGGAPARDSARRLRARVEPFMLRRVKSEVAKDLPRKIEIVEVCDLGSTQRAVYRDLLDKGETIIREFSKNASGKASRMQVLTLLLRLRQACCDQRLLGNIEKADISAVSGKLSRLLELIKEARAGDHRMLVFSQFTGMLKFISESLHAQEIAHCYLDGSTRDRQAVVNAFQAADGPSVFLISLKAGGYGLNLTAADTVVHFDPWWNPAVEAQATDRAYRIGQTKPVTVYKLVARDTVEEKVIRLQQRKRAVIDQTLGEENPLMRGLNDYDLQELLES